MARSAIVRLCRALRAGAEVPGVLPCDIYALYAWTLPLAIVQLPALWTADVVRWLDERGMSAATGPQRRLRACLVASRERGFVLVDGTDPPDEQRYSLAHEAGHFLFDHVSPRRRLAGRLGPRARAIFDGARSPTRAERVDALLSGVQLVPRLRLMERDESGAVCGATSGAESLADEFALELLAPEHAVLRRWYGIHTRPFRREGVPSLTALLILEFGLPENVAAPYARSLARRAMPAVATAEWLGAGTTDGRLGAAGEPAPPAGL